MIKFPAFFVMLFMTTAAFANDLALDQNNNDDNNVATERAASNERGVARAAQQAPIRGLSHLHHVGFGVAVGRTDSGPIIITNPGGDGDDDDNGGGGNCSPFCDADDDEDDTVRPNPDGDDDDDDGDNDEIDDVFDDDDDDGVDPSPSR